MSTNNPTTKRAKLQHGDEEEEDESAAESTGPAQTDEYVRRWFKEDRAATLKLLKNNVAVYEWNGSAIEDRHINPTYLLGDYDILLVHGFTIYTDVGFEDTVKRLCRTVAPGAKLSFTSKTLTPDHRNYNPNEPERNNGIFGQITNVQNSNIWYNDRERCIQANNVKLFHRSNQNALDYDFDIDQSDGIDESDGGTSVRLVTNSGSLAWIPTESVSEDRADGGYFDFMQQVAQKWHADDHHWVNWKEEDSWLCNHKGLPAEAARRIYSFNRHAMPPTKFDWKEGDIWIQMILEYDTEYTEWMTIYLARPRDKELSDRLIKEGKAISAKQKGE